MAHKIAQVFPATLVLEIDDKKGQDKFCYRYAVANKNHFVNRMNKLHKLHPLKDRTYRIYLEVQSKANKIIPTLKD